jgi:TrmH family RNA methyltransferase
MFSLAKFESLPPATRLRKLALLLQMAEEQIARGSEPDKDLLLELLASKAVEEALSPSLRSKLILCREKLAEVLAEQLAEKLAVRQGAARSLNDLRHGLLSALGAEPAEWDLLDLVGDEAAPHPVNPGWTVYIEDIRSPYNVGAIFRTAEAFGVGEILLSPDTPKPTHRRAVRTSRGSTVPWRVGGLSLIEEREGLFALETGGTPVDNFSFPSEGVVLLGSEELGLSPAARRLAGRKGGRVTIPMMGRKRSLNVAVAFGILLWAWRSYLSSAEPKVTLRQDRKEK